jgi:hypothetical protein
MALTEITLEFYDGAMRVVSLFMVTVSMGACAAPPPVATSRTSADLRRQVASVGTIPVEGACRIDGETLPTNASLKSIMFKVVNPLLTKVSFTLFHDPRRADDETRNDDLANAASDLSRCLLSVSDLRHAEDFKLLALLESHNTLALADAVRQYDRNAELHWYQHIKETCFGCHAEYRFGHEGHAE